MPHYLNVLQFRNKKCATVLTVKNPLWVGGAASIHDLVSCYFQAALWVLLKIPQVLTGFFFFFFFFFKYLHLPLTTSNTKLWVWELSKELFVMCEV